jgi:putative tryptophan/tyrosine transport system substrate-binding protein
MITLLVNPNNSQTERVIRDLQEAAPTKGVHPQILKASTASEIDAAFGTLDQLQARALLLVPEAFFSSRQEQLLALAARQASPAIYRSREWTEAGGLISYGTNLVAAFHLVGIYAGRVLKGEKPADLPVQ